MYPRRLAVGRSRAALDRVHALPGTTAQRDARTHCRGITGTGTFSGGGSVATRGAILFLGATQDEEFRAFDTGSGEILFEHKLSAGRYATPCTYEVDGKQYVVIAAGGGRDIGTGGLRSGDEFVALSLG